MLKKNGFLIFSYALLGLSIFVFLCTHSPGGGFDSPGYIHFSPIRPPLYPLFIGLFKWAGSYQLACVMWAQTLINCAVLWYARCWLKQHMAMSELSIFVAYVIIVIMVFFVGQLITAILSEGLAFPLFIMAFLSLIESFYAYQIKKLLYLALWTALLVLTRVQFFYWYSMFVLLIIWYGYKRIGLKNIIISIVILSGSVQASSLFNKSYHYLMYGSFVSTPSGLGELLIVQPLYLTNAQAERYFVDPVQKKYFQAVMLDISKNDLGDVITNPALSLGLFSDYVKVNPAFAQASSAMRTSYQKNTGSFWGPIIPSRALLYDYYANNYNAILVVAKAHTLNLSNVVPDRFMTAVSLVLFKHEFNKNMVFFVLKWIDFTGGGSLVLMLIIIFFTVCYQVIHTKGPLGAQQAFIILGILLIFINNAVVALTQPFVARYLFYDYFIFYCIVAFIADQLLKMRLERI